MPCTGEEAVWVLIFGKRKRRVFYPLKRGREFVFIWYVLSLMAGLIVFSELWQKWEPNHCIQKSCASQLDRFLFSWLSLHHLWWHNLKWEIASIRLACSQVYDFIFLWIINIKGPGHFCQCVPSGQLALGCIRKQAEETIRSKPVSTIAPKTDLVPASWLLLWVPTLVAYYLEV